MYTKNRPNNRLKQKNQNLLDKILQEGHSMH